MLQNNARIFAMSCHHYYPATKRMRSSMMMSVFKALIIFMDELSDVKELPDLEELIVVELEEIEPLSF